MTIAHIDTARLNDSWILGDKVSSLIRYWAGRVSNSSGFRRSDKPDIEQEFRVHLLKKAAKFDSSRAQHSTFAERIIKNKAKSMRRTAKRQIRDFRRNISLDAVIESDDSNSISLAQSIEEADGYRHTGQRALSAADRARLKLDIEEANKHLPSSLRDMSALLGHVSPFAAAEVMGISRRQAARYVDTLRECYEARGLTV